MLFQNIDVVFLRCLIWWCGNIIIIFILWNNNSKVNDSIFKTGVYGFCLIGYIDRYIRSRIYKIFQQLSTDCYYICLVVIHCIVQIFRILKLDQEICHLTFSFKIDICVSVHNKNYVCVWIGCHTFSGESIWFIQLIAYDLCEAYIWRAVTCQKFMS